MVNLKPNPAQRKTRSRPENVPNLSERSVRGQTRGRESHAAIPVIKVKRSVELYEGDASVKASRHVDPVRLPGKVLPGRAFPRFTLNRLHGAPAVTTASSLKRVSPYTEELMGEPRGAATLRLTARKVMEEACHVAI